MEFLMQPWVIFDLVMLAVILFFALLGAKRGLVLSLFSFLTVILALIGGTVTADHLTPPLAEQGAPLLEGFALEHLDALSTQGAAALEGMEGLLPRIALGVLEGREWSAQAEVFIGEFALAMTQAILYPIIFLIAFLLVLILCYFISHALDLVARLPILRTFNAFGGLLFGSAKGILVLFVIYLLIRTFRPQLIPADIYAGSRLLSLFQKAPAFF